MFGRPEDGSSERVKRRARRIQLATAAIREGYDTALVDAGVVLFQQVGPDLDGHYVSGSMADVLGWDPGAFRNAGTLRRLVHVDDLATFRAFAPIGPLAPPDGADGPWDEVEPTIDLRNAAPGPTGSTPTDGAPTNGALVDSTFVDGGMPTFAAEPAAAPAPVADEPIVRFLASSGEYRPMLVRMSATGPDEPVRGTLIDVGPSEARNRRARLMAEIADRSHRGHLLIELVDRNDPSSVVIRGANDSARRLFDLDPAVAEGGRLDAVFDGASARLLQSALFDVSHTGESLEAERLAFAEVPDVFLDLRIDRLRDGTLGLTVSDVSHTVDVEQRLRHQASHDHLTGLPNRAAIEERLALVAAGLGGDEHVAVLLVDVDGLDEINRSFGHHVGDAVLSEIGRRLSTDVSGIDLVARIDGDEFALLTLAHHDPAAALERAAAVESVLEQPLDVDGEMRSIRCTIGAAVAPEHGQDPGTLLRAADSALRRARGGDDVRAVYDPTGDLPGTRRVGLLTELRRGLANQELELRYQPLVDLRTGRVDAVEAILRWQRPGDVAQLPVEFLEMAERSGLIEPLTRWMLGDAARAADRLRHDDELTVVSTNLSLHNLRHEQLLGFVELLVSSGELDASTVEVEISEPELGEDPVLARQVITRLHDLGIGVVIDDFGTGYTSVDTMSSLPVRGLKIDRGYTTAITSVAADADAVSSTIELAHEIDLTVTADGVNDAACLALLSEMGCDRVQGLHLSEPVSFDDLTRRVHELEGAMRTWSGTAGALVD